MITPPARAGLFSKHPKVSPDERVPALIATLRADQDERKRVSAAEELRQFDPSAFPEIIPTLADIAQRDPKSSVRLEAIQCLAKLRPVSQRAGVALEQATHDESMRVRLQARTLLWQYHMAGYRGGKTPDIPTPLNTIRTEEPPLAPPLDLNRGSRIQDRGPGTELSTFNPRSSIVDPRSVSHEAREEGGESRSEGRENLRRSPVISRPSVSPSPPTVGYVAPVIPATPKGNVWNAATSPRPLPSQPAAVPVGPRPLPQGPAQTPVTGPRPLPTGPEIAPENGPKPLPAGPADNSKPAKQPVAKDPPVAPNIDDGPDLSPP